LTTEVTTEEVSLDTYCGQEEPLTSTTDDSLGKIFPPLTEPLLLLEEEVSKVYPKPEPELEPESEPESKPKLKPKPKPDSDSDDEMNTNGKKELGFAKPDPYNGDRTKINKFLQDCQLYLLINEDVYNDDKKKIGFILSLMSKGEVAEWKEQYINALTDPTTNVIILPDLMTFNTKVRTDFKQEDQVGDAMAKLKSLRQGSDQPIKGLVTEFRLLVRQAGLGSTTASDQLFSL